MTDFFAQGIGAFYFHKQALTESGFNYYGRIHRLGRVLIMRENISTGNIDYADGGFNFDDNWADRANLDYKAINKL